MSITGPLNFREILIRFCLNHMQKTIKKYALFVELKLLIDDQ